jgi:hypothetical protein
MENFMKNKSKNFRLKLFGVLFVVFYFAIIGEYVFSSVASFVAGFKQGFEEGMKIKENLEPEREEICFLHLTPKQGEYTFPTELLNLKSGMLIKADFEKIKAQVKCSAKIPAWLSILYGITMFLSIVTITLLIYIPVQAYKTIRSIMKDDIFNQRNITRIRRIGYSLLIIFGIAAFGDYVVYRLGKQLVELADYNHVFTLKDEYIFLLFGLITLLFAEILKISHTMKEEQELTI